MSVVGYSDDFLYNTLAELVGDAVDEMMEKLPRDVLEEIAHNADRVIVNGDDEVCEDAWVSVRLVHGEFEITRMFRTYESHGPDTYYITCYCYRPRTRPAVARVRRCIGAQLGGVPERCYAIYYVWL